jgi:hypothetical protein
MVNVNTVLLSGSPDTADTGPKTALLILLGVIAFIVILPFIYDVLRMLVVGIILPVLLMTVSMLPVSLGIMSLQMSWSLFLSIPACIAGIILSFVLMKTLFEWYGDFLDDSD